MGFHPDKLPTGKLTSLDPGSPYQFLTHTTIGSQYPEDGYDTFFVFDHPDEKVQSHDFPS